MIIVADAAMFGRIASDFSSRRIVAGYVVTPELTEPDVSTLTSFPVNVLSAKASNNIVALLPTFTFGTSISVRFMDTVGGAFWPGRG